MSLSDARLRLASAVLVLVSVGLLASLAPRTSFMAHAADDIVDAVGPVWQEQSVEQSLGEDLGVVSEVRIWAAARFDRGETPVVAALLQGSNRELVRQFSVTIRATKTLQPYLLRFAPYQPVPGETLILQLWVSPIRSNFAIFGTTEPRPDRTGPTLNLNPTHQGPLAYDLIWRGDGWRAALEGSPADASRLVGGIAAAMVAVLLRPSAARRLSKPLGRARAATVLVGRPIVRELRSPHRWPAAAISPRHAVSRCRAIYVFPWLIPAFAMIHFLVENLTLVRVHEAIVTGAIVMIAVTAVFITLRFLLAGAAPAALMTGLLGIIFFSYGHIFVDASNQPDTRYLLGLGLPFAASVGILLKGRKDFSHKIGRILNFASVVLVILSLFQLAHLLFTITFQDPQDSNLLATPVFGNESLSELHTTTSPGALPDIYYIIPDSYPRSGSPDTFDNTEFIQELENRGFYVDPYARSNYMCSVWSITSTLNMSYIEGMNACHGSQADMDRLIAATYDHALGKILTRLGYRYVHVSSGVEMTDINLNADQNVELTPAESSVSRLNDDTLAFHLRNAPHELVGMYTRFMSGFASTTLMKAFGDAIVFRAEGHAAYDVKDPRRMLAWFDYMKAIASTESPKFVFAHVLSPHSPFLFDQYGNTAIDGTWIDDHDPDVESAFHGQLLWLNGRMLELIDAILSRYDEPPIIVIMADHGSRAWPGQTVDLSAILAAYLLPDGGEKAIYPSISSVNVFRQILNYYFDFNLERLPDRVLPTRS